MVSFMDGFNTAKGDIRWEKRDLESSSASTRGFVKLWWNYLGNKKTAKLVFCHRLLQGLCELDY